MEESFKPGLDRIFEELESVSRRLSAIETQIQEYIAAGTRGEKRSERQGTSPGSSPHGGSSPGDTLPPPWGELPGTPRDGAPRDWAEEHWGDGARFERRMCAFVASMNVLSALSTYIAYWWHPPLFPIFFGLFFVFLILAVGLAIDEFVLPVKTFRRISSNAVAVALFWLSIMYIAVSGVGIGTSIITDPFGAEEGRRAPLQRESLDRRLYGDNEAVTIGKSPAQKSPVATGSGPSAGTGR